MRRSRSKGIRSEPGPYRELRGQVLERDGWRCQLCGSMSTVEVHHLRFRSRGGEDCDENLITICQPCHEAIHGGFIG
jgi:5-methylcytosine-specific restriction endonuclease McrA